VDDQTEELWTIIAHGVEEIRIPLNTGVAGYAVLSKEIQIVVDAYNDFRFNPNVDSVTGYVTKTILAIPLLNHDGKAIGVFQAINKAGGVFSLTDAQLLMIISNYASSTLENAMLYRELKQTQINLIAKLSTAAEFKDSETSQHTLRVGRYARLIAENFGLTKEECDLIYITAPMHDAGKIGIPDNILLKPGRLSKDEFEEMKEHSEIGYNLLTDSNHMLQKAAIISQQHHEKYDGTGYPRGLKGTQIDIFARITALADVFDALTSKRSYKEAWSFEQAYDYFIKQKSKHFDPFLVEAFFKEIQLVRDIFDTNQDR
jgi:response regulator RpfG family c-di-GMP phosphodiesterase